MIHYRLKSEQGEVSQIRQRLEGIPDPPLGSLYSFGSAWYQVDRVRWVGKVLEVRGHRVDLVPL